MRISGQTSLEGMVFELRPEGSTGADHGPIWKQEHDSPDGRYALVLFWN